MKSKSFTLLALAGTALLAFAGCASTNQTGNNGRQALVCPQCKMVEIPGDPGYQSHPAARYSHTCGGCQGAMTTLVKEGKLKHKCSVCKKGPFTCPVYHPTKI